MVRAKTGRRRARGLTLIEVMIALLITTIALLGALATVGITIRGAAFSRITSEASVLAQSKLEQLVSLPQGKQGGSMPTGTGIVGTETNIDANGNPGGIYTRITSWGPSPDGIRRICTVEVDWPDAVNPLVTHRVIASRQQALQ